VVFILALDLHHMMLRGIMDSYTLFNPAMFPPVDEISDYLAKLLAVTYRVAIQFAAPNIVGALLLYLTAGVLARLMPNMQVFFVMMPLQLMISFFLIMAAFYSIMTEFARFFTTMFGDFLEGNI
jgi:flagellar biosynthetic protein FliR